MLQLMRENPAQALDEAIGWADYDALPEDLKPFFERPFNEIATLRVLPVCGGEDSVTEPLHIVEMGGKTWSAHPVGRRTSQDTKEATILAGFTLDGEAVVAETGFEALSTEDREFLATRPLGQADAGQDFSTGEKLVDEPLTALAGGKRYLFANRANLDSFQEMLARFDDAPGPHGGSRVVFAMPGGIDGPDGFDMAAAEQWVEYQASSWTETPKSVFFIRVDFSGGTYSGEPITQAALHSVLNTSVASTITKMSYGKTTINATVAANYVRMPKTVASYLPANNDLLYSDAVAAYEASYGTITGAYDIIGVYFPNIGMKGNGSVYAGLAGGSRQWLQGSSNPSVIVHEFGHNYGLAHAAFWDTGGTSVVGAGSSIEYGDDFDIMGGERDLEGHFHMQAKSKLNWLETSNWIDASTAGSGTRRIYRFDDAGTTGVTRAVRVNKTAAPAAIDYYWIGYRPGITANAFLQSGAYLLWEKAGTEQSWLLDTTPGSLDGKEDSAISLGRTYPDPVAKVYITPTAQGGTGADRWLDVNVQIGPFAGNTPPTATLTAASSAPARSPLNFSVAASDPQGDALAYSWDFGDRTPSLNSSSASHTYTVGGTYTVKVTVSDMKGGSVTKSSNITITDPLSTWTNGTVAAGRGMKDVSYHEGRYFASADGFIYVSLDRATWFEAHNENALNGLDFAHKNGRTVMVGQLYDFGANVWRAAIRYTDDGLDWFTANHPQAAPLRGVVAGASNIFVAVGDGGLIMRSTNGGASWTTITPPTSKSLVAVTYGAGQFLAVGEGSSVGCIFTSPDGLTWTDRSAGSSFENGGAFRSVVFDGTAFIAGGWNTGIQRSTDGGVNWTRQRIVGSADYDILEFTIGAGAYVAAAIRKDGSDKKVLLVSADGTLWQESGTTSFPSTTTQIVFAGGEFITVQGGNGGFSKSGALFPSNNAPTVTISGASTGQPRTAITFNSTSNDTNGDSLWLSWNFNDGTPFGKGASVGHTFPVGGTYTVKLTANDGKGGITTATHAITITDPLDNWITRTSNTTSNLNDIVVGGGKLVAVGSNSTYASSTDGTIWTAGISAINNTNYYGVIYDGTRFVAAGEEYDFVVSGWVGVVHTSPDGSNWTRTSKGGAPLRDIAFGKGLYVAAGDGGRLMRSPDAINWTPISSGTIKPLKGISFGNGGFVVVGAFDSTVVLTSDNGTNWVDATSGAGTLSWQSFGAVQFVGDRFLASGFHSKIRHSINNGASFQTNQTGSQSTPAFAYGNGIYLAAGVDLDSSNADINLISVDGQTWNALTTAAQDDREAAVFFNNTFLTVGKNGSIRQSDVFGGSPTLPTPLAWWSMNDSGNLGSDGSGNGNTGSNFGATPSAAGARDHTGGSLGFDGVNDYFTAPTGILSGVSDFTLSTWVYLNTVDTWSRILDFGSSTGVNMFLTPKNGLTGTVRFAITTSGGGGEQVINGTAALPSGKWTHVAVTLSGSVGKLYVDGQVVGTNTAMTLTPASLGATTKNYLGKSQYPDPYLNGSLDEVALFSSALTAEQIAAIMTFGLPSVDIPAGNLALRLVGIVTNGATRTLSLELDGMSPGIGYHLQSSTTGLNFVDLLSAGTINKSTIQPIQVQVNSSTPRYFLRAGQGAPVP